MPVCMIAVSIMHGLHGSTHMHIYLCILRLFQFPSLVSGPPASIKVVNVTVTTITLSWQPPEHPGGAVRGYRVTVNGTVHDTLPWQHTLQITNLIPGSNYAVVIQALNGAGGGETSGFFIVTLDPGEPVVPHACEYA